MKLWIVEITLDDGDGASMIVRAETQGQAHGLGLDFQNMLETGAVQEVEVIPLQTEGPAGVIVHGPYLPE